MTNPDVSGLIEELRALGARITTAEGSTTEADVKKAEAALGFPLPVEYREFVLELGGLEIEHDRTWNFYGLDEARALADAYRDDLGGTYVPRRFIVVHDEGEYSNAASGTVYDADLEAFLVTAGGDDVAKDEAFAVGYWGYLLDELEQIRDRIVDPDTAA